MEPGVVDESPIRVLWVTDPERGDEAAVLLERRSVSLEVTTVADASDARDAFDPAAIDCVVSAADLPGGDWLGLLETVRRASPEVPFLVVANPESDVAASDVLETGASDYLRAGAGTDWIAVLAARIESHVDRRRSADALERQGELFEQAQALASLGAWEYDVTSGESWLSTGARRIHGVPPGPGAGSCTGGDCAVPSDHAAIQTAFDDAVSNGDPFDLEVRFEAAGERRTARITGESRTEAGEVVSVQATIQDVTDRKRQTRRYRTLVENLPGIVYRARIDPDWPFEYVHGTSESFTGYSTGQLQDEVEWGREVLHPDDREWVYEEVEATVDDGGDFELRYRIMTADDEVRWVWERGRLVDDGFLEGFITDVTSHVEYEQELERYETIVEASGDGVYTLDTEGRLQFVNESLVEMAGLDREALVGEHVSVVMDEADVERGADVIRSLLSSSASRETFEMDLETADGDVVPCENHVAVLEADGEFRGTVGVLRDVTDRKRRERALERQTSRLDEFASVVSHDLRNPLGLAQGYLERARETGEPEAFDQVEHGLDRMERIVDDVLWLAREGKGIGETERLALGEVVETAWRSVVSDGAPIELVADRDALGTVEADRERLCQLLENLLSNAVEHAGPDVTVRVTPLDDGFAIEDDGSGIPEAERERVFDRGYTTDENGTGLGLHIVGDIVGAHGWALRLVESDAGGARFEIRTGG